MAAAAAQPAPLPLLGRPGAGWLGALAWAACTLMPRSSFPLPARPQVNDSSAIISRLAAEIDAGALKRSGSGKGSSKEEGEGGGFLATLFGGGGKGGRQQAAVKVSNSLAPASPAEEEKWRRWVDDWFVKVRATSLV